MPRPKLPGFSLRLRRGQPLLQGGESCDLFIVFSWRANGPCCVWKGLKLRRVAAVVALAAAALAAAAFTRSQVRPVCIYVPRMVLFTTTTPIILSLSREAPRFRVIYDPSMCADCCSRFSHLRAMISNRSINRRNDTHPSRPASGAQYFPPRATPPSGMVYGGSQRRRTSI